MSVLSGVTGFFGLDIGVSAVRLVQLGGSGTVKSLLNYGYIPIDSQLGRSDAPADHVKLGQAIQELIAQATVTSRNVVVGLPSQRVFTTVVDIDRLSPDELAKTIEFQADSLIPTPLSESTFDWALAGDSPVDKTKSEVIITSVPNEFVERRLDMLENIGLNVIAFEPDAIALARALLDPQSTLPQIVLDIGSINTDMVISIDGTPRLTRQIPTGTDAIIKSAIQNLNIDSKQAEQFVFKFGLAQDKLEGQVYQAIIGMIDTLVNDVEKSIAFFQKRYGSETKIDKIILTGGASTLPEFPLYLANKFGVSVEIGNAWRNVSFPAEKQNELLEISNHFSVAAGLAERLE